VRISTSGQIARRLIIALRVHAHGMRAAKAGRTQRKERKKRAHD
jgi:hypothetical protein